MSADRVFDVINGGEPHFQGDRRRVAVIRNYRITDSSCSSYSALLAPHEEIPVASRVRLGKRTGVLLAARTLDPAIRAVRFDDSPIPELVKAGKLNLARGEANQPLPDVQYPRNVANPNRAFLPDGL